MMMMMMILIMIMIKVFYLHLPIYILCFTVATETCLLNDINLTYHNICRSLISTLENLSQ